MKGPFPFLLELVFALFPLAVGAGIYKRWRSSRSNSDLIGLALIAAFFLLASNRFINHLGHYWDLRTLTVSEVHSIEVNGITVSEPDRLTDLVASLNEARWFSYNHDGAAKRMPMLIKMRSGEQTRYAVAYYLREEGAVIEFSSGWGVRGGFSYGQAFCERLPQVLDRMGKPLPKGK